MPKKRPRIDPKKRAEILRVEKPDRFTDAEWDALSPRQKILYSNNNGLWKPGETSSSRGKREPKAKGAKPLAALTVISGDAAPPPAAGGGGELTTTPPAFEVHESDDLVEVARVNAARLMADAYKRAARVPQKVDPFDQHVYLALVGKIPQLRLNEDGKPETPAQVKENVRLLSRLLKEGQVGEGEFREVKGEGKPG